MEGFSKVGKGDGRFRFKKTQCKEPKVWVRKVPGCERRCISGKRIGRNMDWTVQGCREMRALGLTGRQGRERRNPGRSGIGVGRSSNSRLLKWFRGR